jgi:hypothetical protein
VGATSWTGTSTLPKYLSSTVFFCGIRVAQSLVFCVVFHLFFCTFSFGNYIVCHSIYSFWLPHSIYSFWWPHSIYSFWWPHSIYSFWLPHSIYSFWLPHSIYSLITTFNLVSDYHIQFTVWLRGNQTKLNVVIRNCKLNVVIRNCKLNVVIRNCKLNVVIRL